MKKIISAVLVFALALALCTTAFARQDPPVISSVSCTAKSVSFSGTTDGGVAIVAQVVDSEGSALAMESFLASNDVFSGTISGLSLKAGNTYTLKVAYYDGGEWVTQNFTVPKPSVTPSSFSVTVEEAENGKVEADRKAACAGDTVILTVTPDKGWTLETITVTKSSEIEIELTVVKEGESFTFEMPSDDVTVVATFMEDNTMLNYFVDVFSKDYYYDAVLWAVKNDVTDGVDDTHFKPAGLTTRAQMVTFLWRVAGSPVVNYAMNFTDVPEDTWYTEAVRWAVSEGITDGVGNNKFNPDADVTRAQAVTFLYRYSKAPAMANMTANGPAPSPFKDVSTSAYYYNAVLWAVGQKITDGTGDNMFSPNKTCSRGETVTFLYRYFAEK